MFFLTIGFLIDVHAFLTTIRDNFGLCAGIVGGLVVAKMLAAFLAQKIFRYSPTEGLLRGALRPLMNRLSNISLVIVLGLIPAMNSQKLLEMIGTRAIPAAALFVSFSFAAGYLSGGFTREARRVLGFGSAARNIPAAMLVGGQNFDDPNVIILVTVAALLSLLLPAPLAVAIGRSRTHGSDSKRRMKWPECGVP